MIRNNYFDNNYSSLYFEYGCDSHVLYNRFLPDPSSAAGPQIVVVAPNVRIIGNDFFGSDNSSQPDVLLKPIGTSTDGGWGWIVDNKFGAERETFNPKRSRIAVTNIPKDYPVESYIPESVSQSPVSGPTTIRGNHFLGPGVLNILSISRVDKQVYIITEPRHGIPIGENASFNIFIYNNDPHSPFNGTFTITAINGMTLTYLQEVSNNETFCNIGSAVVLSTGKKLTICGRSRSNNWATVVTTSPHDIPIPTKENVKIEITGEPAFSGKFEATSINEMTLSYQNEGSDASISCSKGYAALINGKAILLDYYIDNWDISHNLFYHYGILIDDEMEPLIPNPANPSIFEHNRVISLDGINYEILKNNRIQFY
jgi:hypothetical protein